MERSSQRVIHAYCHVRTNQVLYSFSPALHNAAVARQFPDTGANTSFTKLRKDLWRPLWTMSIPEGKNANAQGRHAFKKLREWRKLHETSWEPPALLSLNHSPKEIERMADELEQRGGSKINNVYDIIRHKKKKMRVQAVLDQRANSIADLAAVLAEQETLGANTQKLREESDKSRRDAQVKTMLELAADAEKGGIAKIEAKIANLTALLESPADQALETSRTKLKRKLNELRAWRHKMVFSADAVAEATEKVPKSLSPEQQQARIAELLPNFPEPNASIPKRGALRARLARANAPIFNTAGVVIKWANSLDAEYAEAWPETIEHKPMGLSRHRAPRANEEAVMDVASYRSKLADAWEKAHPSRPKAASTREAKRSDVDPRTRQALQQAQSSVLNSVKQAVAKRYMANGARAN